MRYLFSKKRKKKKILQLFSDRLLPNSFKLKNLFWKGQEGWQRRIYELNKKNEIALCNFIPESTFSSFEIQLYALGLAPEFNTSRKSVRLGITNLETSTGNK